MADREHGALVVQSGARIRTHNGSDLGTVGEVLGDYFEVLRGDEPGYWLARDELVEAGDRDARVGFRDDELAAHIVRAAPDRYRESEYLRGHLSAEEEHQRELMLSELSEQRARMAAEGRATREADGSVGPPVEEELEELRRDHEPER